MTKVKFTTNIDKKLLEEIKIKAIKEGKNVNEIIENQLKNYLEEKEMTKNNKERYYEDIIEKTGGKWDSYTNLYDEDFNLIRSVKVRERVVLEGITRIVKEADKDNIALLAYNLTDLGNGFYKVEKDEDTKEVLEAIAKNIK